MASNHHSENGFWSYLINPDKSASPQLTELCLGLAKIICKLNPPDAGPPKELTPQRLAAFYKSVGGNYDSLFLNTSKSSLSYIYTTLGCFHTLQPGESPFHAPNIPALTPTGYARWQTIQLLLCPNDHVPFLQTAVGKYDIPRSDGGYFPKYIPKDVFPDRPDEEMDRWHREVTGRIYQDNDIRRLKNSPYPSPYNAPERSEGYFSLNGNLSPSQIRHTSRPSRGESRERDLARRRSSVPELPSPHMACAESVPWGSDPPGRSPDSNKRVSRSHSAQRPPSSSQPRPSTSLRPQYSNTTYYPPPNNHILIDPNRPMAPPVQRHSRQRSSGHRPRSPSTIDESSGGEASSENSQSGGRVGRKRSKERRSSLWVPSFFSSSKRRHSHDASYEEIPPKLPPRTNGYPSTARNGDGRRESNAGRPDYLPQPYPVSAGPRTSGAGFDNSSPFRVDMFTGGRESSFGSPPESSSQQPYMGPSRPSTSQTRYPEPLPPNSYQVMDLSAPLSRERSESSGNSTDRAVRRTSNIPFRLSTTATGVGGRRYPNAEPRSAVERRSVAPMPV